MDWDLGLEGLGVLALMSLAFGVFTQLVFWGFSRWLWAIASAVFFVAGLVVSEGVFGWATVAELQPNIDGLSFDEVLLAWAVGALTVVVARFVVGRRHRPAMG
jgi:hypothetical protein